MMNAVTPSRRNVLVLGLAGLTGVVAGCSASRRGGTARESASARTSAPVASGRPTTAARSSAPPAARLTASPEGSAGFARQVSHGSRTGAQVALTFHGGGDPALARQLLDVVTAHRVSITVMAVGTWLEANPDLAVLITRRGHELGNHTQHHLDINSLPPARIRTEIVQCRDLLTSLVGTPGVHFRQSQSPTAAGTVRRAAAAAGYATCLSYDIDSLDYTDPGPAAIRANVARARAGSIVSLHLGHAGTVTALPDIIGDLRHRGLHPVTARALLADA